MIFNPIYFCMTAYQTHSKGVNDGAKDQPGDTQNRLAEGERAFCLIGLVVGVHAAAIRRRRVVIRVLRLGESQRRFAFAAGFGVNKIDEAAVRTLFVVHMRVPWKYRALSRKFVEERPGRAEPKLT